LTNGINFFDTANQYGAGEAEYLVGEALRKYSRDRYFIATKLFFPVGDDPDHGLSAAQIEKQLDNSLRRMKLDTIDLYQCHRFDPDTPLEETLLALKPCSPSGKDPSDRLQRVDGGANRVGVGPDWGRKP